MNRPAKPISSFLPPDPMADAVLIDTLGLATDLGAVLETLKAFDQSSIEAIAFKKPPENMVGNKAFQLLGKYPSPIVIEDIVMDLKTKYGGGEYRITVMAGGRPRKQIEFPIFGEPITPSASKPANDAFGGGDFFKMMMLQQSEAASRQLELARLDAERRDRAAERTNALIMAAIGAAMPALIPVLTGANREKLSEVLAVMRENKPDAPGLKDMVEIMVMLKSLTSDDKPDGFNPDDIAGSIARLAGPTLAGLGQAFRGGRATPVEQVSSEPVGDGYLHLEGPPAAAPAAQTATTTSPAAAGDRDPLLAFLAPHVFYFFSARHDPGLAAEAITDMMQREGVTEADVGGLVTAFAVSADWQTDLAGQGIDLRDDPQWAEDFRGELVDAWSNRDRAKDRGAGRAGRAPDAARDENLVAGGLDLAGDSTASPGADE